MWHRCASSDRSTNRSDARSPYAKNYRTNLTHDQREQLSHRQNISRLPRREFEDRYIALLDEYYALKKENAANNQKIKKMATKLLRLSAEGKSRGTPFPQQLAPNENLEIQIIRLEAYNSLLKDRLNAIIKKYSSCIQSTTTSTMRRPASCSNLSIKRKIILSEDDLHLLEIPEPPTIISKDNRSSIGSGSAITSEPKQSTTKMATTKTQHHQYQQSQSSIIFENDNVSNVHESIEMASNDGKSAINNLKNIIQKLQSELNDAREANECFKRLNFALEEKITDQLIVNRTAENVELVELRRTMVECEMELHELREQYLTLKAKAENDLDKEHKKIDELTQIVKEEMNRNTNLSKDLQTLRNAATAIEGVQNEKYIEQAQEQKPTSAKSSEIAEPPNKNDDLTDLLNEAKSTILELQSETESLKHEIEILRQQNRDYVTQIELNTLKLAENQTKPNSPKNESKPKTPPPKEEPVPIPLEPIVIVNENNVKQSKKDSPKHDQHVAVSNAKYEANHDDTSMETDQTTQSDNTYVLMKEKPRKPKKRTINHHVQNSSYSTTDSEISSLDSDDNFRTFQNKNKKIQSSMMLPASHQPVSMSFSQRMSLLEKVAFYRPLVNVTPKLNEKQRHRYLACDCKGFECDQQIELFYEEIRRAVKNARSIMLQEIQNNPQIGSTHDDTSFNKLFDDSSECREFLRVQYNLNNLFKQELEIICKTCKKQRQDLLKQIDVLKSKLQSYEDKFSAVGSNDEKLQVETFAKMLYVDYNEGSFEFHISSFRPTKEGRPLLSCRHGELGSLYVSWNFYECKFESKTSIRLPPNYTYDSSHIYVVAINRHFLARIQSEKLIINLFAPTGSSNTLMGAVDISLAEVLIFPQNKIQLTTKVMSISDECEHSELQYCGCNITMAKPKHLGNLTLWFRLTCELDVLKSLYNEYEQWRPQTSNHENNVTVDESPGRKPIASERQQKIGEPTNLDARLVSNMKNDQPKDDKTLVCITILCLKLNNTFELPTNATELIHIEYMFLGSRRLKTEPKPLSTNQITFNFIQKYTHNERNLQRLTSVLKDLEHSIKFILVKTKADVSKSLPESNVNHNVTSEDESRNDSLEIGFGLLHLGKFIDEWNTSSNENALHTFAIPILSKKPPYQNIGSLDISIEDILVLKSLQQQY